MTIDYQKGNLKRSKCLTRKIIVVVEATKAKEVHHIPLKLKGVQEVK
jgi:hypothetical protein